MGNRGGVAGMWSLPPLLLLLEHSLGLRGPVKGRGCRMRAPGEAPDPWSFIATGLTRDGKGCWMGDGVREMGGGRGALRGIGPSGCAFSSPTGPGGEDAKGQR